MFFDDNRNKDDSDEIDPRKFLSPRMIHELNCLNQNNSALSEIQKTIEVKLNQFHDGAIKKILDQPNELKLTPLYYAARYGCDDIFLQLYGCGANISIICKTCEEIVGHAIHVTPLHVLILKGKRELAQKIIQNEARNNSLRNVFNNNEEMYKIIKIIINKDEAKKELAKINWQEVNKKNMRDKCGWGLMQWVVCSGDANLLNQLIVAGFNVGFPNNRPNDIRIIKALDLACIIGQVDCLQILLENGASIKGIKYKSTDTNSTTSFHFAAINGHYPCLLELAKLFCDPDSKSLKLKALLPWLVGVPQQ